MIAPNVPGPIVPTGWREKHARRIVNLSPTFLSSTEQQYNNRRVSFGFSLAELLRAARRSAEHRNRAAMVKNRSRMAMELKEQL